MNEVREPDRSEEFRRESLRAQMRRFRAMSLADRVRAIEGMCETAAFFAEKRRKRTRGGAE